MKEKIKIILLQIIGLLLLASISFGFLYSIINSKRSFGFGRKVEPIFQVSTTSNDTNILYSGTEFDATYIIDGQKATLKNGKSEIIIPKLNSKTTTLYFGNGVKADLDKDGRMDDVFLITQQTGGSGRFFYVVARLNKATGPIGSEAIFLGDRISPQSTELDNGKTSNGTNRENVIVVNYADRNPGEPMTTQPSLGKSIWLKLDINTMQFGEVAQNFEGEAR